MINILPDVESTMDLIRGDDEKLFTSCSDITIVGQTATCWLQLLRCASSVDEVIPVYTSWVCSFR